MILDFENGFSHSNSYHGWYRKRSRERYSDKDAESLEVAKNVNAIVFDKTGTITEGKPIVTDLIWLDGDDSRKDILFNLEKLSEHPLADAVVNYLGKLKEIAPDNFESITGKGIKGIVNGVLYYVGNEKLLEENHICIGKSFNIESSRLALDGKTVVWFADNEKVLAVLGITDQIKETSAKAISIISSLLLH